MKKTLRLFLLFILLFIIVGCSNDVVKKEDVLSQVKEYKKEQYTIKDPSNPPTGSEIANKVKEYLSEKAFEKLNANRVFQIAPDVAKRTGKSIELEDVILENEKENDNGTIEYTYILKLKFDNGKSIEEVEKKGQLTISKDGLIIIRDWEERTTKIDNVVF